MDVSDDVNIKPIPDVEAKIIGVRNPWEGVSPVRLSRRVGASRSYFEDRLRPMGRDVPAKMTGDVCLRFEWIRPQWLLYNDLLFFSC